ncbi:hypothetical protein H9P43_007954 [Blastocladiella emersonii ATCC 22665]|nr:hypothetical protein H9P43_007952 [Blastocladiella emersonii ATCC 22665]KAI9168581.1 hypothetical protein H9P43_007954 [Blastocladiella emersonii ATCC 22665]
MVATTNLSLALVATATLALLAASAADPVLATSAANAREIPLPIPEAEYIRKPANPADDKFVLRAHENGEFMGSALGATKAKQAMNMMHPMPVKRNSFAPVMTVKAMYGAEVPSRENVFGKPAMMVASCDLNTKMASVNLDNFPQITKVECSAESVTLTFNDAATAAAASAEWAKTQGKWAVIVGGEWKCDGAEEIATREVTAAPKAAADGTGKVVLATKKMAVEDVVADFSLKVAQHDMPSSSGANLARRDLSNSVSWDLAVNWDKKKRKPLKPFISLLNTSVAELGADISLHGRATFSLEATGSITSLKTYRVALSGDIGANLDLFLRAHKEHKADLFSVEVFVLPLTPFYIPGIFSMSPELRLKAAATYELAASLKLSAGLELSYPFVWSVESKTGLFGKPIAKAEGDMRLRPHPPTLSGQVSAGIAAHVIPAFGVGLRFWRIPIFDLALELDSSLGMTMSAGGKAGLGNDGKPGASGGINVEVAHEHSLDFHIRSVIANKAFNIWSSGKQPLPALSFKLGGDPNQRIDGSPIAQPTATSTAGAPPRSTPIKPVTRVNRKHPLFNGGKSKPTSGAPSTAPSTATATAAKPAPTPKRGHRDFVEPGNKSSTRADRGTARPSPSPTRRPKRGDANV